MLLVYQGSHAMVPFFSVFSEFMVSEFAGDPKISVEMILVKKNVLK